MLSSAVSKMTRAVQLLTKATFRQTLEIQQAVKDFKKDSTSFTSKSRYYGTTSESLTKELSKLGKNDVYTTSVVRLSSKNCYDGKITQAIGENLHIEFKNFHGVFKRPEGEVSEKFKVGTEVKLMSTTTYEGPSTELKIESVKLECKFESQKQPFRMSIMSGIYLYF